MSFFANDWCINYDKRFQIKDYNFIIIIRGILSSFDDVYVVEIYVEAYEIWVIDVVNVVPF